MLQIFLRDVFDKAIAERDEGFRITKFAFIYAGGIWKLSLYVKTYPLTVTRLSTMNIF